MVFYHEIFLALPRHSFSDGGLDIQLPFAGFQPEAAAPLAHILS